VVAGSIVRIIAHGRRRAAPQPVADGGPDGGAAHDADRPGHGAGRRAGQCAAGGPGRARGLVFRCGAGRRRANAAEELVRDYAARDRPEHGAREDPERAGEHVAERGPGERAAARAEARAEPAPGRRAIVVGWVGWHAADGGCAARAGP
jgi:hypothetical protein